MVDTSPKTTHRWRFFRAGGFDQVLLDSGLDLLALSSLDQKLWLALSCPTTGVEFDAKTLSMIDSDRDGHIRVPEILAVLAWLGLVLKNPDQLTSGGNGVPLSAIKDDTEEGRRVLASARTIIANLGKGEGYCISVDDTRDSELIFAQTRYNGDGVVTTASTDDELLQAWIARIIECYGGIADRSGETGVNRELVERFSAEAGAWRMWQVAAQAFGNLGENPESIIELWHNVKDKIEDYFLRCRLAAYNDRAAAVMNSTEQDLMALAGRNLAESGDDIAALPLAVVRADQTLDLKRGINPAWQEKMTRFGREVVPSLPGGEATQMTSMEWELLKARFAPYEQWWKSRIDTPVATIGLSQLIEWEKRETGKALQALIEKDLELQPVAEAMVEVERLTRYCRDLYPLLNNFVSFRDFYTGRSKAIFQTGTLYLDGRSFELCVRVLDIAKHAALAAMSRVFLVYCDCIRGGGAERMTIAAAVTNGDADQLSVGRNGVFYDRQGLDWDATVVRLIEHPISIRQAFWDPYKRLGKMVSEQMQKLAAARSKAAEEKRALAVMQLGQKQEGAKPAPPPAFDVAKFAGIFAAIGLAVGAIGTAIAAVVGGFLHLMWWQMPLAIAGMILLVSGPSIVIAWFKLRQRNLGPILDANGWAVNARAKLNIPFGASLTGMARLPEGATQLLADPFAEKRRPWRLYLLIIALTALVITAWQGGWLK